MNYCGIDLASKTSAVCIDDEAGRVVTECEVATDEDGFRTRLAHLSPLRCVLEASPLAEWAAQLLEELGHEVVVIDPRRAKAVICTKRKTDQIDARNLAKMARTGWYTAVHRKSASARRMRTLLKARAGLLGAARSQQSRILGLLRAHGVKVPGARGEQFEPRVRETVRQRAPELEEIIEPLLRLWDQAKTEADAMEQRVHEHSKSDPVCRLLMSAPGVGPMVSAAYVATIDDPHRFDQSAQVSDYVGLVPFVHQSGDVEYRGRITKEGDSMLRWLLVEAANVLLTRVKRSCALKHWGLKLASRKGMAKARVAVARKLAALLHRMWITGEPFDWART